MIFPSLRKKLMYHKQLMEDDFTPLLADVMEQPVYNVRIKGYASRPYSRIWFLDVKTDSGILEVVAKSWESDAAFEKQVSMLETARAACADEEDICIPYISSLQPQRLLLMPKVHAPSILSLCRFSLQRPIHVRYLHYKKARLITACTRAGRWLRRWHTKTAGSGSLAPAFDAYLSNRSNCLALMNDRERDQLLTLTKNLEASTTCIPHGDFTPVNLLSSSKELTVLDFGLSEWERMTPWWDYTTMEIGLFRALRFTLRGLGTWSPAILDTAVNAFRNAYGESNSSLQAKRACLAVRHLVLYASDIHEGKHYRHRAEWHKLQLSKALAEATQKQ